MKTDIFFGLTDREIATAVALEMGRRKLNGCLFMYPESGGAAVFASSSPPGTLASFTAAEQLTIFAEVAAGAVSSKTTALPPEPESKGWIN